MSSDEMRDEQLFAIFARNPDGTWGQYAVLRESDARRAVQLGRGHVRAEAEEAEDE